MILISRSCYTVKKKLLPVYYTPVNWNETSTMRQAVFGVISLHYTVFSVVWLIEIATRARMSVQNSLRSLVPFFWHFWGKPYPHMPLKSILRLLLHHFHAPTLLFGETMGQIQRDPVKKQLCQPLFFFVFFNLFSLCSLSSSKIFWAIYSKSHASTSSSVDWPFAKSHSPELLLWAC